MTLNITQRDKKILVFLAAFIIVIPSIVWGILPLIDNIMETSAQIKIVKSDVLEMQTQIKLYDSSVQQNEALKKESAEITAKFYPVMQSQDVDRLVTGIILSNSLTSTGLEIEAIETAKNISPYYTSSLKEGSQTLSMYNVSLKAMGSSVNVAAFIDNITNNYPAIHVDYFTILPGSTDLVQMQIQIYMYN